MTVRGDNKGGGQVTYYSVPIRKPSKGGPAYEAEAIDIINALNMTFAEGEAFKSIWRCAASRFENLQKEGGDAHRDAQKVEYYGKQMQTIETMRKNGELK